MRTIAMVVMGEFTRSSNRQEYLKRSLGEPLAKRATVRRSFLIALYRCYTSAISQLPRNRSLGRALGVPWRPCRAFCEQTPAVQQQTRPMRCGNTCDLHAGDTDSLPYSHSMFSHLGRTIVLMVEHDCSSGGRLVVAAGWAG
jgi:hypothetical protein